MKTLDDRIKGCMVGGAAGDALGYAVEFMSYRSIMAMYGEKGITRYELNDKGVAEISDDTQMSLYTLEGLKIGDMRAAYLEWLQTQSYDGKMIDNPRCSISRQAALYSRRAPGNTCLSALNAIACGREAKNNSKGCGGIMRVAPIALWGAAHGIDVRQSVLTAFEAARLTHKHTLGWLPAGMLVYVVQKAVEGEIESREQLIASVRDAAEVYDGLCGFDVESFKAGTELAIKLADTAMADEEGIRTLGEGWTGEEAWYIALFCVLRHFDSFEEALVAAVNHNGDSDSTGAVAGNIMGALHGYAEMPAHFTRHLELHDLIVSMANFRIRG